MDVSKLPPAPWFVNYDEQTDDCGHGVCGISVGLHEDDSADAFLFSHNFQAGDVPDEVETVFEFVVRARQVFDILMNRHWVVMWRGNACHCCWPVSLAPVMYGDSFREFQDVFTAVLETEVWMNRMDG